jgi:hypothetical protein
MKDSNNEYIGGGGVVFINKIRYPSKSSIWANPYKIDKNRSREEVIQKLGCWCYPEECQGNVLMQIINEYNFEISLN